MSSGQEVVLTSDKPSKMSIYVNGGILAVALSIAAMLYGIRNRQELMEQRQVFAQERTGDQLQVVSGDIKELTAALREGLKNGSDERALLSSRVNDLEDDYLRLENRVSNIEE